jgi:hypothetical protein
MDLLLGLLVMMCLPAYLALQVLALVRWPWRVSRVPLLVMGAALVSAVVGFAQDSNLAPIFVVLCAPFCLLWLGIAGLWRR